MSNTLPPDDTEDRKKFAKYLEDQGYEVPAGFLPPEEQETYNTAERLVGQAANSNLGKKALKALGYAGNIGRTIVQAPLSEKVSLSDIPKAITGDFEAPLTSDVLKDEYGWKNTTALSDLVPQAFSKTGNEYLKLKKGGLFDLTGRGVVGGLADMAMDPTTYLSLGSAKGMQTLGKLAEGNKYLAPIANAGSKAKRAVINTAEKLPLVDKIPQPILNVGEFAANPIQKAQEWAGKKLYRSGMKNIDQDLQFLDKAGLADQMLERGPVGFMGSAQDLANEVAKLKSEAGKIIGETIDTTAYYGGKVPIAKASEGPLKIARTLRQSGVPEIAGVADDIENRIIGLYAKYGDNIPANEAQQLYTDLGKIIDWGGEGAKTDANKAVRSLQQGVREQLDTAIKDTLDSEALAKFQDAKKAYASTASADKSLAKEIKKEVKRNPITQVDVMLPFVTQNPATAIPAVAAKKAVSGLQTTRGATTIGNTMYRTGAIPQLLSKDPALWDAIQKEEEKRRGIK